MMDTSGPFEHSTPEFYDMRKHSAYFVRALDAVTAALARWDGNDAPMSAHVVTAGR